MKNHLQYFLKKHLIGGFSKNTFKENTLKIFRIKILSIYSSTI